MCRSLSKDKIYGNADTDEIIDVLVKGYRRNKF